MLRDTPELSIISSSVGVWLNAANPVRFRRIKTLIRLYPHLLVLITAVSGASTASDIQRNTVAVQVDSLHWASEHQRSSRIWNPRRICHPNSRCTVYWTNYSSFPHRRSAATQLSNSDSCKFVYVVEGWNLPDRICPACKPPPRPHVGLVCELFS